MVTARAARALLVAAGFVLTASSGHAQNRTWAPEDRSLVTGFGDVAALALGRDRLYVASDGGVAVFDVLQERWLPPLAPVPGYPPPGYASALAYDPVADGLWLGLENGELYQLSFAFGEWTRAGFVADDAIIRIHPDAAEGALWVGTPVGWYRVRDDGTFGRFVLRAEMLPESVRTAGEQNLALLAVQGTLGLDERLRRYELTDAVAGDRPGTFFVGTGGGGVVRIDTNTLERQWYAFGTPSRGVGTVEIDADRIWFGGDGQGPRDGIAVASRDLGEWRQLEAGIDGAPRGFVARIVADADAVWFAASDGVYRLDGRNGDSAGFRHITSADGLPADQATTVVPLAGGAWIGTLRGLARIDATGAVTATLLEGSRVLDLVMTGDTLWIATDRGLHVAMSGRDPEPAAAGTLAAGPVVAVAAGGGIVAALTPDALHVRTDGLWSAPDRTIAGTLGGLLRLRIEADGRLWIAGERGVASLEAGVAPVFWRVPDDIPEGPVRGIAFDGNDLWVATPAGALRLDRTR